MTHIHTNKYTHVCTHFRLLSRPARAGQLAPWLRALLHHHTGYLMAAPGAQAPLAALYQAIDGRVRVCFRVMMWIHVYGP